MGLLVVEIFLVFFYPQNIEGHFGYQLENGLWVHKNNYTYFHRSVNRSVVYHSGNYHNRIIEKKNIYQHNKKKVLILGESYTFGWLIDARNTYVNKLQLHFKDHYFINASMPGWGAADYTSFLDNFCVQINPQYTIIILNTDDITRSHISNIYQFDKSEKVLIDGKNQRYKKYERIKNLPLVKFLLENSHLVYFAAITVKKYTDKDWENWKKANLTKDQVYPDTLTNSELVDSAIKKNILIFEKLKTISTKCNSKLSIISLGWVNFDEVVYDNPEYQISVNAEFYKNSSSIFNKLGIAFFDNTGNMKAIHNNLRNYIIASDYHPNEAANMVIYNNLKDIFYKILN